jgi:LysM repeat protein
LIRRYKALKIHMVKNGDSLNLLAKKYHLPADTIVAANPQMSNQLELQIGMKIKIPSGFEWPGGPITEMVYKHTVVQGDTLWKLSKAWNIPLQLMVAANPQLKNPSVLMTGEIVNVPKYPLPPKPAELPTDSMPDLTMGIEEPPKLVEQPAVSAETLPPLMEEPTEYQPTDGGTGQMPLPSSPGAPMMPVMPVMPAMPSAPVQPIAPSMPYPSSSTMPNPSMPYPSLPYPSAMPNPCMPYPSLPYSSMMPNPSMPFQAAPSGMSNPALQQPSVHLYEPYPIATKQQYLPYQPKWDYSSGGSYPSSGGCGCEDGTYTGHLPVYPVYSNFEAGPSNAADPMWQTNYPVYAVDSATPYYGGYDPRFAFPYPIVPAQGQEQQAHIHQVPESIGNGAAVGYNASLQDESQLKPAAVKKSKSQSQSGTIYEFLRRTPKPAAAPKKRSNSPWINL